jgi:UDP-4-amino-4,6-dideoxy-N-acetyl-beta-L-altrosamine N-acetyltransferase
LTAPEVRLRPIAPDDRERLHAWRNLPEVAAWMYSDHEISADEHARWFAAAVTDPARRYWIIEMDRQPVGLANLADISPPHRKCAWAYYLADPATRGRGVGSFVEFCVIDHVFGSLGLNKLTCEVLVENEAVWKLHESFGFTREALFRAHVWKQGRPRDVVGLGMLASDWARQRPAAADRLAARGFDLDTIALP